MTAMLHNFPNLASQLPKEPVAIIVPRRDMIIRPGITLTVETLDSADADRELDLLQRALKVILKRLGLCRKTPRVGG